MKRSPAAAFWLSILPGAGHVYLGQASKGIVLIVLAFTFIQAVDRGADGLLIIVFFLWFYAMIDAYRSAQEQNRIIDAGGTPAQSGLDIAKWWGWALIVLGAVFLLDNLDLIRFDWVVNLWPVGLIVLGAYILMNKTVVASAPAPPTPAPPPHSVDAVREDAPVSDEPDSIDVAGEMDGPAPSDTDSEEPPRES